MRVECLVEHVETLAGEVIFKLFKDVLQYD